MKREKIPQLKWDTSEITRREINSLIKYNPELSEQEAFEQVCEETFLFSYEFDILLGAFQKWIDELIKNTSLDGFLCTAKNFGWRNSSGIAEIDTTNALGILSKILPDCECTYTIFNYKDYFEIQNAHHDSPTGNEWYILTPAYSCDLCGGLYLKKDLKQDIEGDNCCPECFEE